MRNARMPHTPLGSRPSSSWGWRRGPRVQPREYPQRNGLRDFASSSTSLVVGLSLTRPWHSGLAWRTAITDFKGQPVITSISWRRHPQTLSSHAFLLKKKGSLGFFKRRADFRQAGIAMKKTGNVALRFDKHIVVAGICSFRAQVKEGDPSLRTLNFCRGVTGASSQSTPTRTLLR